MKIKLLKLIDRLVGVVVAACLPSAQLRPITAPKRLLLIRPGGIGDAVLLSHSIISIRKSLPDIHITVLAERRNCGVFALIPPVDKVFCYDRPGEFIQALLGRYDVVIDTEQSYHMSAVVARLVRAPMKIGFGTDIRRRMFTHSIGYDMAVYEPDNFASLLKPLGVDCSLHDGVVTLSLPPEAVFRASQLLRPLDSGLFVAIFPGASIPEKRWGGDRFRRVAEALSSFGVQIVVVGGNEERRQGETIADGGVGLNLAGTTSLSETAAVIQKSSLLLSGDSGVLHIAAGLGVPTVSLFGPGRAGKWAPQGERHLVINKGVPCSPCSVFGSIPLCIHDNRCMRLITVDEVVNAVTMLLTSTGAMPPRCCKRDWIETIGLS